MKAKVPTLLAIFLLLLTTISFVLALKQFQQFRASANTSFYPHDLKITNIKNTSFTVSWVTTLPTIGFVKYQTINSQNQTTMRTPNSITHFLTIQNLNPNTTYSFRINSNGQDFDNNGSLWSVQTSSSQTLATNSNFISGTILNSRNLPAKNSLVYITIGDQIFSTQVSVSGNWIISLPPLAENSLLGILVEESPQSLASVKTNLVNANPIPTITLGHSYNFLNEGSADEIDTPNVPIQLP